MDDLESFLEAMAAGGIEGDSFQCRCQFPLHPPQSFFRVKEKDDVRREGQQVRRLKDSRVGGIHTYSVSLSTDSMDDWVLAIKKNGGISHFNK